MTNDKILQLREPPQLLQQGKRQVRREAAVGGPPAREERGDERVRSTARSNTRRSRRAGARATCGRIWSHRATASGVNLLRKYIK